MLYGKSVNNSLEMFTVLVTKISQWVLPHNEIPHSKPWIYQKLNKAYVKVSNYKIQ